MKIKKIQNKEHQTPVIATPTEKVDGNKKKQQKKMKIKVMQNYENMKIRNKVKRKNKKQQPL